MHLNVDSRGRNVSIASILKRVTGGDFQTGTGLLGNDAGVMADMVIFTVTLIVPLGRFPTTPFSETPEDISVKLEIDRDAYVTAGSC